jgi:hypothetical protein
MGEKNLVIGFVDMLLLKRQRMAMDNIVSDVEKMIHGLWIAPVDKNCSVWWW